MLALALGTTAATLGRVRSAVTALATLSGSVGGKNTSALAGKGRLRTQVLSGVADTIMENARRAPVRGMVKIASKPYQYRIVRVKGHVNQWFIRRSKAEPDEGLTTLGVRCLNADSPAYAM